ncbi:putative TetR family transcriptional regulator [Actinacidiphila reveromycinica]|uniref:Putative TetR family transcriptional regulator n=1 Tax=Actinacidiphila reveromycinica TaxID=659352 RepID=A0A7U3V0F1_9ACTN|nr:TetR/AcrR family transcriptional regulator [Streptomyces sp. SN-593]BBB02189.1 putative TetR family transcriptional regulator [Streptomyces sp. SN-593]
MSGPARGRRAGERKGDLRERAILDTCEALLAAKGYDAVTVGDIAQGAGITRGALYFYFGSKQEVVTALVARTVEHLWERSRSTARTEDPRQAVAAALRRTVELWTDHGLVMRTAIDLSLTVPEIGALWDRTADLFIAAITSVLERAGVRSGAGPDGAAAMGRALCWMIERSFYHASQDAARDDGSGDGVGDGAGRSSDALQEASATCEHIWLTCAGLAR